MNLPKFANVILSFAAAAASIQGAAGQQLPSSVSFTVAGNFGNAAAESASSVIVTDNNLTNGYMAGYDAHDAPAALNGSGPAGSALFQWGKAYNGGAYPHSSAAWFSPLAVTNAIAEQTFNLGYLYYRNGTIETGTGVSSVDIGFVFSFSSPSGLGTLTSTFTSNLINTTNSGTEYAQADIIQLASPSFPTAFVDSTGKMYYLELSFKVDEETLGNSNPTGTEYRVYEGKVGRATVQGKFTVAPGGTVIPEASTALIGALASLALLRRKRKA